MSQISLSDVLGFKLPHGTECSLKLPTDICFGSASVGGLLACIMTRYVVLYAAQHERMSDQPDVRSTNVQFHRPVFPDRGPITMTLHEVSVGFAWSTVRVELSQGRKDRINATCDVLMSSLDLPGPTAPTPWKLSPAPPPVDLENLDNHEDPRWICYHTGFHHDGFRRGGSYARTFIPVQPQSEVSYVEQWMTPGWDCSPQGSSQTGPEHPQARWTNDMIQFAIDMSPVVQANFAAAQDKDYRTAGSTAALLSFATAQKQARDQGNARWRELASDGSHELEESVIIIELKMDTEIKSRLPDKGVRWLYLRSQTKALENGRSDKEVLLFGPDMTLVAVSHLVEVAIPTAKKASGGARL